MNAQDVPDECWELISRYRGELLNQACAILGNAQEAEDVVQETFCDAFKDRAQLAQVESIGAWLRSINRANALSHQRAAGSRTRHHERNRRAPRKDMTTGGFSLLELRESVAGAIEALPDAQRAVVVLRCWEGLPYEEIGARLGVPEGTARRRFHEATVMLYEKLGPQLWGDEGETRP